MYFLCSSMLNAPYYVDNFTYKCLRIFSSLSEFYSLIIQNLQLKLCILISKELRHNEI